MSLSQSCGRTGPLEPTDNVGAASSKQELPFHPGSEQATTSANDGGQSAASSDPQSTGGLPFRNAPHARIVPSGTLLTVDLQGSLSTAKVHAGDFFTATLAAPLRIDGDTLIQRGAPVTGRIESAQSRPGHPGLVPRSGYFELTLVGITIDGKLISLQTSSLFTRGIVRTSSAPSSASASNLTSVGLRVQKGRPLTFRLIAPVALSDVNSAANSNIPSEPLNNGRQSR